MMAGGRLDSYCSFTPRFPGVVDENALPVAATANDERRHRGPLCASRVCLSW